MSEMGTLYVVDDDASARKGLTRLLHVAGYHVCAFASPEEFLSLDIDETHACLLLDVRMPGKSGLDILNELEKQHLGLPVIVITAHGTVSTAVSALKKGAIDYVTKPFDKDELKLAVRKALSVRRTRRGPSLLAAEGQRFHMIGSSPPMLEIFNVIEKVAGTPSTVL